MIKTARFTAIQLKNESPLAGALKHGILERQPEIP
jgi:hypothetical protein